MSQVKKSRDFDERRSRPTLLSDFVLGSQDGLVNVLGIVLGVAAGSHNANIILLAALAALRAESVSMGAVAYTSTAAERRHYLREREREGTEMKSVPGTEKREIRVSSKGGAIEEGISTRLLNAFSVTIMRCWNS